jgi:hypothetical protein
METSDWAGAQNDYCVLEARSCLLMGGEDGTTWLCQGTFEERHFLEHPVNYPVFQYFLREDQLLGETTGVTSSDANEMEVIAQVIHPMAAVVALATTYIRRDGQTIAGRIIADAFPHFQNYARRFVAGDNAVAPPGRSLLPPPQVRAADPACLDFQHEAFVRRNRTRNFSDFKLASSDQHSRFHRTVLSQSHAFFSATFGHCLQSSNTN